MDRPFTHREFKLLLKADRFPTKRSVVEFNANLAKIAADCKVPFNEFDSINSQFRQIQFFDTEDQVFRRNRIILRVRRDQSGGWPDETWELTLKCRSPDIAEAENFDVASTLGLREKRKFKEELLRDKDPGTMRCIYSNNNVMLSPQAQLALPMAKIIELFPGLKALRLDSAQDVVPVNGAFVFEIESRLGTFIFGKNAVAEATIALWLRPIPDAFSPMIAEFGYAYHVLPNEKKKQHKAHDAADRFFKDLQKPLADWIADATTKTAFVYGTEE